MTHCQSSFFFKDLLWFEFYLCDNINIALRITCMLSLLFCYLVMSDSFVTPTDCSLPVSCVYGISQSRILAWIAISFFGGSSWPRGSSWPTSPESPALQVGSLPLSHWGSPEITCYQTINITSVSDVRSSFWDGATVLSIKILMSQTVVRTKYWRWAITVLNVESVKLGESEHSN